ncbi:MAG: glutamate synthase subunit beta [Bacteroidetes bacterium]|nr:glutamate synthase subunit beta [Bacteroidota bacterium]MCY4204806.1 glutamate synthase subunit beta [Bacteroidota bacterium]
MGKTTGFIEFKREMPAHRPVTERVKDWREVYAPFSEHSLRQQAARCMDCGIPFCQSGCPLGNVIPDWNDLVYRGDWKAAYERLSATNNFPEFTGRICPAPCETACVLGIIDDPVTIEQIEQEIIEYAFREGWVHAEQPVRRTGKKVAVIGSGPAGLAAADQLNRAGHRVTVLERDDRIGGLLRYGIPDFKLEKWVLDRRLDVMKKSGIQFITRAEVGGSYACSRLRKFDAVVICTGATKPRNLPVKGRKLSGIHYAFDYLRQQNKLNQGDDLCRENVEHINAAGKDVIVIGGGDTGSDCVGTANRQGASSVTQFELLPTPPDERPEHQPWPYYPMILRTGSSHQEGADRHWSIMTKAFEGKNGYVESLKTIRTDFVGQKIIEHSDTQKSWPADLVLLAIGYTGPESDGIVDSLGLKLDHRSNFKTGSDYQTNVPGIFAAGDARRGQSLVVWAISEGREAARHADAYLSGFIALPTKGAGDLPHR